MAFWGGMGGMGGGGMMGRRRPGMGRPNMGQQGLRRSVDAWDDEELGAAYNHQVVVRLAGVRQALQDPARSWRLSASSVAAILPNYPARGHRRRR